MAPYYAHPAPAGASSSSSSGSPTSSSSPYETGAVSAVPAQQQPQPAAPAGQPHFQVISLGTPEQHQIREYKRRKFHRKSRAGCLECKKKRVKCDQTTPVCLRCQRNNRSCVYENDERGGGAAGGGSGSSSSSHAQQQTQARRLPGRSGASAAQVGRTRGPAMGGVVMQTSAPPAASRAAAAAALPGTKPVFRILSTPPSLPVEEREYGTPTPALLHHFQANWYGIFDMPHFTGSLMPMAQRFPHVRCTVLAVAASHLRHKAPGRREHRVAEHFQQTLALQAYQHALATPLHVHGQAGTDALLITAMLMNMLAFVLPPDEDDVVGGGWWCPLADPSRSWVFSPRDDRLGWLALQMGLRPLLTATAPWRERSFLGPLFRNSDDERRTLTGNWQSLRRTPLAWTALFGLDRDAPPRGRATEADRLFRGPLRVLAELRGLPPTRRNVLQYFQFMSQLEDGFRERLFRRDERALWVFGMWLGLMCRFDSVWWCDRRTRRDFRAIRLWLHHAAVDRRPGEEGRLWRQVLRDLDATWGYDFSKEVF